jgi:hypothetical protein
VIKADRQQTVDVQARGRGFVVAVTVVAALVNLPAGVWLLLWPESFAEAVRFPPHVHFEHDASA